MRVAVNGVKIWFDVEGAGLVPDGEAMRKKPTLIALHGGPGADHSIYKPQFSAFADVAQVVYLDHRGNGRSDQAGPETWNLAQWGDDVRAFCEALGIEKPVVYGASFGGFVAQAYATRHPDHVGKLILASTAARFDFDAMIAAFGRIGGDEAREAAADYWLNPTVPSRRRYAEICVPLYSADLRGEPDWITRLIQ
ncbi:MAG: alpha/beta fold hydrolase, partial [Pseudomonadota bacterium]